MNFLKSRFRLNNISMWFGIVAIVIGIALTILYPLAVQNDTAAIEFNPNLEVKLVVMLILATVVEFISLFLDLKEIKAIAFFLFLYDFITYAGTQGNYLANIFTAIDGSTFSSYLIAHFVLFGVVLLTSLLSMILLKETGFKKQVAAPKGE